MTGVAFYNHVPMSLVDISCGMQFALTLAAVRRGACASKRDFDDLEAEKSRREKERA
jgi:hypothetical protein